MIDGVRKLIMNENKHLYAVILAGGGGTRLWPKSRNATPKQFLKLTSDKTMMQLAANRAAKVVPWENIIVVTNKLYEKEVAEQLPKVPESQIIAEPERKETAMAMLVGAMYAKNLDPDAVIINMASDHIVTDDEQFVRVMEAATSVAREGESLITVGITPTFANTGFGYVQIGKTIKEFDSGLPLYLVKSFREKPDRETAEEYVKSGNFYWNANMYVWSATALDEAFEKHMPDMFKKSRVLENKTGNDFHNQLENLYQKVEKISIDYAISERADNLVLIPGDFGWDDVGDWKVVSQLNNSNGDGNVVMGDGKTVPTLAIESSNNLIHAEKKLVAMVGVNDMIVIDTDEILMIVPKERSQEVKKLVERLKEEDRSEYL